MTKTDERARASIIDEWVEEITTSQQMISNFNVVNTGLAPARKEILALLERAKQYAESKRPGFDPFDQVVNQRGSTKSITAMKRAARNH